MCIFRKCYDPQLIDLVQYEKDVLYEREHWGAEHIMPPGTGGSLWEENWSIAELEAMRENMEKARAIYDKYRYSVRAH